MKSLLCVVLLFQLTSANTFFSPTPGSCAITGDVDVYGIGIRLGYYCQYAAAVVALLANRVEDTKGARNGFNAFTTAVLINTFRDTSESIVAIEWYIVFLLAVFMPLSTLPLTVGDVRKSKSTLVVQTVLTVAFVATMPWLWYKGIGYGQKEGCDIKVVFFAVIYPTSHGWVLTGKIFSVLTTSAAVAVLVLLFIYISRGGRAWSELMLGPGRWLDEVREDDGPPRWLRLLACIYVLVAIAFVESTLLISHIDMSAGPLTAGGQLIPFVIGIYIFVTTAVSTLKGVLKVGDKDFDVWLLEHLRRRYRTRRRKNHLHENGQEEHMLGRVESPEPLAVFGSSHFGHWH